MNKVTFIKQGVLALIIVISLHLPTRAQQAGDFYGTLGWLYLAPQSSSTTIKQVSSGNTATSVELPGTAVRLGKSNTLGFYGGYHLTDKWAVEFTAGIPPKFKIKGWGTLSPLGEIAKTTAWTPILQAKYRQPIVKGLNANLLLGATYCWFTNSNITNSQLDLMLGGPTSLAISSAFRPVFSGGLSYALTKSWFVNGTFSYIPLKVTGTLDTKNQTTTMTDVYKVGVDLNPIMTYVSVGYVFKNGDKVK